MNYYIHEMPRTSTNPWPTLKPKHRVILTPALKSQIEDLRKWIGKNTQDGYTLMTSGNGHIEFYSDRDYEWFKLKWM